MFWLSITGTPLFGCITRQLTLGKRVLKKRQKVHYRVATMICTGAALGWGFGLGVGRAGRGQVAEAGRKHGVRKGAAHAAVRLWYRGHPLAPKMAPK